MIAFFTIAWFIRSICSCVDLPMSIYPYPAMLPSTGNSASTTNGYSPSSYSPVSAMGRPTGCCTMLPSGMVIVSYRCSVSFSVACRMVSPTSFAKCSTCRPF